MIKTIKESIIIRHTVTLAGLTSALLFVSDAAPLAAIYVLADAILFTIGGIHN